MRMVPMPSPTRMRQGTIARCLVVFASSIQLSMAFIPVCDHSRLAQISPDKRMKLYDSMRIEVGEQSDTSSYGPERSVEVMTSSVGLTSSEPEREKSQASTTFTNDGPFKGLVPYLDLMGIKPGQGKSISYGPIPVDLDLATRPTEDQSADLRKKAAQDLTNINMTERQRRDQAGDVMWAVSAIYISWASLIADDGGLAGHFLRLVAVLPLFLAVGYKVSAKTGLCNIAQSGLWDVDGTGLQPVDDPNLARVLLDKVNAMNFDNALKVGIPATIFAALPQQVSSSLVLWILILAVLFLINDKSPQS